LQLLQMALEKLAKAFLYHAEPNARYSHHVVQSALNRLRSHAVAEAAGMKLTQLSRMLDAARPIFCRSRQPARRLETTAEASRARNRSGPRLSNTLGRPIYRMTRLGSRRPLRHFQS
jgi:hypothetical protein